MPTKTYDPKLVVVDFAGILINSGYADGTLVKTSRNEDTWSLKIGADGEAVRIKNNNRSGRVEVTLLQSSSVNDLLSQQAQFDEATNAGQGPVSVTDVSGKSLYVGPNAWIVKPADGEFGKDANTRTWIFETDNVSVFNGGNV
jgi:hypothetical protein